MLLTAVCLFAQLLICSSWLFGWNGGDKLAGMVLLERASNELTEEAVSSNGAQQREQANWKRRAGSAGGWLWVWC